MEANKLRIETDWQTLKNSLLIQNETNHAQEESDLPNVFGDERQWSPENIGKSGHSSSKSKLRHAIAKLEVFFDLKFVILMSNSRLITLK
jgi:hypothetical protein